MSNILEIQKEKQAIKPPKMWKVLFLNDDFTTFEFVMAVLMHVFNKGQDEAFAITQDVHQKGKGVVGLYTKEIAQTKQAIALEFAKENEHPLQVIIEES